MQALSDLLPRSIEQIKPNGQKPQLCEPQPQAVTLLSDPTGKQELAAILFQCFQSLKVYGKEPEALESVIAMHNLVLADYPIEKIRSAFAFYLRHNTELPAPADIANIIDRGGKPAFDRSVYLSLVKRKAADPYAYNVLSSDELQYIKDYEKFMVSGKY